MKNWLAMALAIGRHDDHGHREAHGGDAVEEAHRGPAHGAEERAAHARRPVFERQRLDVRVEPERMQQPRTGERQRQEQRRPCASDAHSAFHNAREARALRRLPKACATKVCTARPTPPNSRMAQLMIQ